jgi:small subunit ribosomal protein S7
MNNRPWTDGTGVGRVNRQTMGKRTASAETLKPDPIYDSILASKFINCLMWGGKKATAQRVFYDALNQIKKRMPDLSPIDVFTQAVENVKPSVEVRSKRVGGATYQVPMQVKRERQQSLSIRWIIGAARNKSGRPMFLRLADELMAGYRREGEAMTKRENTIKMAEANKAFSHFAW